MREADWSERRGSAPARDSVAAHSGEVSSPGDGRPSRWIGLRVLGAVIPPLGKLIQSPG